MDSPAGLSCLRSCHEPTETMERLIAGVTRRSMTIFAHIDHAAGAADVGLKLRPTDLLVFGAARGGTPLMQAAQTIGIDLPLKAMVWQDADGAVWIGYNDPGWIASRHGISPDSAPAVTAMRKLLAEITHEAAGATVASS